MSDAYKSVQAPPTGRGSVQTSLGKPGGPGMSAYQGPAARTQGPADFALPAAVAGHNDPQQSIPRPRPTQAQRRDNALAYMAPRPAVQAPPVPVSPGGAVQTDMTGRQPYAGREPVMVQGGQAAPGVTADSDTHPGRGGLTTGHTGPLRRSGNMPISYRPSDSSSAAEQGVAARDFVRGVARANGGMPADLESPGRGSGPVGINPPGSDRGPGMESHG